MSWTHTLKRSAWLAAVLLRARAVRPAWAQTTGTGSTDNGTCEGMTGTATIAGKTYVSVGQVPIPSMSGYVYNRAECECKTRDLGMRIEMSTPIPMGTSGVGGELWVGAADCTTATARQTTGTICEKTNTAITVSSFMSIGTIDLAVPSETIPNPKPVNWMPTAGGADLPVFLQHQRHLDPHLLRVAWRPHGLAGFVTQAAAGDRYLTAAPAAEYLGGEWRWGGHAALGSPDGRQHPGYRLVSGPVSA